MFLYIYFYIYQQHLPNYKINSVTLFFRCSLLSFTLWQAVRRTSLTATGASSAVCWRQWLAGIATVQLMRRCVLPNAPVHQSDISGLLTWVCLEMNLSPSSCSLPGVCQLPWFLDSLQSHTFRRREQSWSARLWELQACGAQVALHANQSEPCSCIFFSRTQYHI